MKNRICCLGTAVGSLMLASCATTGIDSESKNEADYLAAISKAEYMLAEWGSASASPISFQLLDQAKPFKFDMDKDATFYFDSARTNKSGAFSILKQSSVVLGLAGKTSEDKFQQQRVEEELAIYQQNQQLQEDSRKAYQQELESYRQQKKQNESLASENYQFCQATVVEMQATASAIEDAAAREQALKAVITQRNACLDTYLTKIQLTKPQPASITNSFPSLDDQNVPANNPTLPEQLSNRDKLQSPKDLKESSGLADSSFGIPDHEALRQAATNFWLQQMFEVLGNPNDPNNQSLFGVSMVSVNPGWRSRKDYKAQIDIQGKISYEFATEKFAHHFVSDLKNPHDHRLAVAVAYQITDPAALSGLDMSKPLSGIIGNLAEHPDTDRSALEGPTLELVPISPTSMGQNTDLDSVSRSDWLLSLSLSQALSNVGAEAQAEVFSEYARRQQRSAAGVTALNSVNVYSYGSSTFGVEVGPQFQAADTSDSGDSQGEFLQRQTFPVLMAAKLRDPRIYGYRLYKNCGKDILLCLLQPALKFVTSHRWLPIEKPWLAFLGSKPTLLESREVREISRNLATCPSDAASQYIRMRCTEILSKLAGTFVYDNLEIESRKTPTITGVFPSQVAILADDSCGAVKPCTHEFVLTGHHLRLIDTDGAGNPKVQTVFSSGQAVTKSQLVGSNIHVSVAITRDIKEPILFRLEHDAKPMTTASISSGIARVIVKKPKPPSEENVTIQVNGKTTKIPKTLDNASANIADVLEALSSADCQRMERKIFKIGDKTLEIPEGYCDVPANTKFLLEKLIKQ